MSTVKELVGPLFGVISAYWGGAFDLLVQRLVDAFMAFPVIILATLNLGLAVIVEASLSFLGVGPAQHRDLGQHAV